MIWKSNKNNNGLYSKRQLSNQFCSWWPENALASKDPNRDPIATLSICLYNILNITLI